MQQFNNKVEKYLLSIGAKKRGYISKDYTGFCYEILTSVWLYDIICHEADKGKLFCIFTRFHDHEKALAAFPFIGIGRTGKCNIFQDDAESALNCLKYRIEKTTLPENIKDC